MTAELAVVFPAVALILALALGGVQVVSMQVRVTDAAAAAARVLSRGDSTGRAAAVVHQAVPGAILGSERSDDLVCARVEADAGNGLILAAFTVAARSCALEGGR